MEAVTIIPTARLEKIEQNIADLMSFVTKNLNNSNQTTKPLNLYEAAEYLGRSYDWTFKNKHNIGCSRAGNRWVMTTKNLDNYINSTYHKNQ